MKAHSPLVVYYHSVAPALFEGWPLRFLTMQVDRFEDQLRYMARRKLRAIFLDEWSAIRTGKTPCRGDEICITFDDGLLDNWVYAYPLILKYGLKMTLFVCPELIEPNEEVRPNLEDVWQGRERAEALVGLGQLSWGELKRMQASGQVDVQSHTMSHAKYPNSGRVRGYYYGGFDGFYPLLNTCDREEKPRYMSLPGFSDRLPMGTPLFEEASSVVARKHSPDSSFMEEVTLLAGSFDLNEPKARTAFERAARSVEERFTSKGMLLAVPENLRATNERVEYEVRASKQMLEARLGKTVEFLCWPIGDNDAAAHALARSCGYLASTAGKMTREEHTPDRIPRVGTHWDIHPWLVERKFDYKFYSNQGRQPYRAFWLANAYKNQLLGKS